MFDAISTEAGVPESSDVQDDLDREAEYHERFMLPNVYVGLADLRKALLDYIHGDVNKPLLPAGLSMQMW